MGDDSMLREFAEWVLKQDGVALKFYDMHEPGGFYSPTPEQVVRRFKRERFDEWFKSTKKKATAHTLRCGYPCVSGSRCECSCHD